MSFRDGALLLLGHGSTLNADSSAPTYEHAEEIRRRGLFAEVHVGFWKEEPNFRQALRQTDCDRVYVVPNFISSGYFTEQIIPRELGLTGTVTRQAHQEIIYCEPVGLNPAMREALLQGAREIVAESGERIERPEQTACLFICGHGTSFNDNSTKIIHEQSQAIRALGLYADCQAVLMEQTPFVKDWRSLTPCADVIVVPFFISDGLHSFEDIPVLLGLSRQNADQGFDSFLREGDRRLWYASAIGTEKFIADVILAQVGRTADGLASTEADRRPGHSSSEEALHLFLQETSPPWRIGQVAISDDFALRHIEDAKLDAVTLRSLVTFKELRDLIRLDDRGRFRPLRAAPNLRRGWSYRAGDISDLRSVLDYLYPAELANWNLWKGDRLPITPWRETSERQTGRFRIVREVDHQTLDDLVGAHCEPGCLKKRLWSPANEAVDGAANELPLLCPEACNFLVGKAREKLKGPAED